VPSSTEALALHLVRAPYNAAGRPMRYAHAGPARQHHASICGENEGPVPAPCRHRFSIAARAAGRQCVRGAIAAGAPA